MKIYVGTRDEKSTCLVTVQIGKGKAYALKPRLEIRNHSPTGFEWGYGGSGPAQLALALLVDHTGNPALATSAYQDFKFQVVGRMPCDGWELTGAEIDMWLRRTEAERLKFDYFERKWDGAKEVKR